MCAGALSALPAAWAPSILLVVTTGKRAGREELLEKLARASNEKVLRGAEADALRELEHVHERANALGLRPWAAIAAYRLAHLRMRTARGQDDLQEADDLFVEAAREEGLGPWPDLFRLAVLHRLERREMLARTFERAKTEVRAAVARAGGRSSAAELPHDVALQEGCANALELCCYFLGAEYDGLEGLGALPFGRRNRRRATPQGPRGWYLVSHGISELARDSQFVLRTHALARAELDALGERYPGALLFELPALGVTRRDDGRLWMRGRASIRSPQNGLRHLVAEITADHSLVEEPDRMPDDTRRQQWRRLRKAVGKQLGVAMRREGTLPVDSPVVGIVEEG